MTRSAASLIFALAWLCLAGPACARTTGADAHPPPGDAEAVAEWFLDRHYVEIDLEAARNATRGHARARVDQEIALVQGVRGHLAGAQGRAYYERVDGPGHRYLLTVQLGATTLERELRLELVEGEGRWWVESFSESERSGGSE